MTTPTRSAGNEVNQGMSLIPGLVRGDYRVPPETYTGFDYDLTGGTSDNWDEVANALNFANHSHGWPTSEPWEVCVAFAERQLAKPYLEKEGSLLSAIYYEHHTWNPKLAQYAVARFLGQSNPRLAALADGMRGWLRAGVLWSAIVALDVVPKGLSDAEKKRGPRPGTLTANGAPHPWTPIVAVGACGGRGWTVNDDREFPWYVAVHTAGDSLAEFGLGRTPNRASRVAEACRDRFGAASVELFSAEEQARVLALMGGDLDALRWAKDEIGPFLPVNPVRIFRATGGVNSTALRFPKGATSAAISRTLYPDGRAVTLSADSPIRGKASAYNRAQTAVVDIAGRRVTAHCDADDNQPESTEVGDLPPGRILWDFTVQRGAGWQAHSPADLFAAPQPEPAPIPSPDPTPKPKPSGRKVHPAVVVGALIVGALLLRAAGCF